MTNHDQLFDREWIRGQPPPGEVALGNEDASSLADLGASFTVVPEMRIAPIDKRTPFVLAVAAAFPMAPVVFIATPTDELVRAVLKMLFFPVPLGTIGRPDGEETVERSLRGVPLPISRLLPAPSKSGQVVEPLRMQIVSLRCHSRAGATSQGCSRRAQSPVSSESPPDNCPPQPGNPHC